MKFKSNTVLCASLLLCQSEFSPNGHACAGCFVGEAVFVARRSDDPATAEAADEADAGASNEASGMNGSAAALDGEPMWCEGSRRTWMWRGPRCCSGTHFALCDQRLQHLPVWVHAAGAAVAAAAAAEDTGYLITLVFDGRRRRSSIVILDAADPAAGPVATLHLRRPLPFAFHCFWTATCYGPLDGRGGGDGAMGR